MFIVPKNPEPECRVDRDCQTNLACIGESCQNPCRLNNPCKGEQKCVVKDTLPTRTVACVCPEGTVFSDRGYCQKGIFDTLFNRIIFLRSYFDCIVEILHYGFYNSFNS